jgi:hypothetical protein
MTRKPTALANLDIASEGLTHQDGLAERIAKQRGHQSNDGISTGPSDQPSAATRPSLPQRDANGWRRGKSLLQVAIPEETHVELSIIAKRRRMTLSQLVKVALNGWLSTHGHQLHIPE